MDFDNRSETSDVEFTLSRANSTSSATSNASKRTLRKEMEHFVAPVANRFLAAGEKLQEHVLNPVQDRVLNPVSETIGVNVMQPISTNVTEMIARKDKSIAIAPSWLTGEQDPFFKALGVTGFFKRFFYGAGLRYIYGIGLQLQVVDTFLNTLSLINALIVTIPFSVMGMFNSVFWDDLQSTMTLHECGNRFTSVHNSIRGNIVAVLCFALIPLLITTIYYIVRPSSFGEVAEDETLVKITNAGKLLYQEEDNEVDIDNQVDPAILQRIQVAIMLNSLQGQPSDQDMNRENRVRAIIESIVMEARNAQRKDRQNFYYWWQRARLAILIAFVSTMCSVYALSSLAAQIMQYYTSMQSHICGSENSLIDSYIALSILFVFFALYVLL
jgi:hypothetical protein